MGQEKSLLEATCHSNADCSTKLVDPGMEPAPGAEAPEIKEVPLTAREKEGWAGAEAKAAVLLVLDGRLAGLF